MEPASTIILKCGGAAKLARGIGMSRTSIYKWTHPKSKSGTNGVIPYWQIPKIIQFADNEGISLSEFDFVKLFPRGEASR